MYVSPSIFSLPQELDFFSIDLSGCFSPQKPFDNVSIGALIFEHPGREPRLLLLQHSTTTDPHAFATVWEIPNGSPTSDDPTFLDALERIIFEQTGLQTCNIHAMSDIKPRSAKILPCDGCVKMLFTVQVDELISGMTGGTSEDSTSETSLEDSQWPDWTSDLIVLDPQRHSQYAWVTEAEIREFVDSGLFPVEETKQYEAIVNAFAFYKHDRSLAVAGRIQSCRTNHSPGLRRDTGSLPLIKRPSSPANLRQPIRLVQELQSRKPSSDVSRSRSRSSRRNKAPSAFYHRFRIR